MLHLWLRLISSTVLCFINTQEAGFPGEKTLPMIKCTSSQLCLSLVRHLETSEAVLQQNQAFAFSIDTGHSQQFGIIISTVTSTPKLHDFIS